MAALALLALPLGGARDTEFDAFPAYLWRTEHLGRPLPAELLALTGGTDIPREDSAAWVLDGGGRFYLRHAPGRNALHLDREAPAQAEQLEDWRARRDPRALARRPCLSDPETAESLLAQLERSLALSDRGAADFVALGDEVSVTPWGDPLDLCRSPHCDAAWEAWLAEEGARYGLAEGTSRPTTDAVLQHPTGARLAAWLAARAFQREVLASLLERLAERVEALRPGARIALLGLIGETAHGGVDLERVAPFLDVAEPYAVGDARERLATMRVLDGRPKTLLATVFLDRDPTPAQLAEQLAAYADSSVDGVVVWSDRELGARTELKAPLAAGLRALRRGPRPADRDPRGSAWLASDDSLAHSWLRDARADGPAWWRRFAGYQERHGQFERRRRAWFEAARKRGEHPGAVDVGRVGLDLLPRFESLNASGLSVLSDEELAALDRYVQAGGQILVEPPFATLRPDGSRRAAGALPAWAR
ncbi:MAG: hypothetical protein AAFZ65_09410 [Planctomycetota bacterium]